MIPNLTINITNATLNNHNLSYVCYLDQIKMLEQLERTPKTAYWFLFSVVIILLVYIFIPKLKEYFNTDQLLLPLFIISFASLFFYTMTTFNITRELWDKYINPILIIISLIGITYIIYKERERIKQLIKRLRE